MGIMDHGTGEAAAGGGAMVRSGETCGCGYGVKLICMSGGECFLFFLMVVLVKYDIRGVCRAFPTHTQEHFWDTKRHFCRLRICGSLAPKIGQQMRRILESQLA